MRAHLLELGLGAAHVSDWL